MSTPEIENKIIVPTIGRKLWVFIEPGERRSVSESITVFDDDQPLDATIVLVHPDKKSTDFYYVTVVVLDHMGDRHVLVVPLRQAGQNKPDAREWAEWMPYQVGQAKKQDQAAPAIEARYVNGVNLAPQFDFGLALHVLKSGLRVARQGWNGKGMFIYLVAGSIDANGDDAEKFARNYINGVDVQLFAAGDKGTVTRMPNINMRAADGSTVTGWLASQTDMLAEDWTVVP